MNALPTSGENLAVTIRFKTYGCIVLAGEEESLVSDVIKLFSSVTDMLEHLSLASFSCFSNIDG
jgi:hypothetical protein